MGYLSKVAHRIWIDFRNAICAVDDLKTAIENNDSAAACAAISHATPEASTYYDPIVGLVLAYAKKEGHDKTLLQAMRDAAYNNFDSKFFTGCPEKVRPENKTAYKNPFHIYGLAAYMDDVAKIRELGALGITPDNVSNYGGLTESIVMGTARLGAFGALKEVVRQGASLDKGYGLDEYPPLKAFSKPLFHVFHPGVTAALLQTGNQKIAGAVNKALAANNNTPRL